MRAPLTSRRPLRACARHAAAGVLLLASGAALLAGCARPEVPLQPVYRLIDVLDAPLAKDALLQCDIADEFRLTIGCLPIITIGMKTVPRADGDMVHVSTKIPPVLSGNVLVVEPRVRGPHEEWRRPPTMLLPRPVDLEIDVDLPLPAEVKGNQIDVQLFGRPVPANAQKYTTRALAIGRGARLSLGLGLDPLSRQVGASPVEFRVTAETRDGKTELLQRVLDPATATAWQDELIDLARFTGQRVRFTLETSVLPRAGVDATSAFGLPLWGAAQVLEPRLREGRRNVILISVDTLRGDQLGGSLGGIPLMPELTQRASEGGAIFENAFTTYPSTTAGHMTMFTGLYPAVHNVVFATGVLSPQIPTLPEVFARNGYATVAVTEDAMLTAYVGFVRGFDYYREFKGKTMWATSGQIEQTFGAGLQWIENHPDERFFLFLHTYQVHAPYEPPEEFDLFKTWEKDGKEVAIDATTPRPVADRHHYAGEVRYTDAVLKRLLDRLDELGVLDDTIVAVTGDHGDEFGEHGQIGHAKTAYDEVLHVPLVFLAPGLVPTGKRVDTPVSLIDLMPTLLDLAHLPIPPAINGTSLVPLLRGTPFPASRVLYAEAPAWGAGTGHRVAARSARFKFIGTDVPGAPLQVYDLTTDPHEKTRLDDPQLAAQGAAFEAAYRATGNTAKSAKAATPLEPAAPKKPELDERTIEKLKQLGYVD